MRFAVTCSPDTYADVLEAFQAQQLEPTVKEVTRMPTSTVELGAEDGRRVLKLLESLDDHDDVQSVSANFNLTEETLAEIGGD